MEAVFKIFFRGMSTVRVKQGIDGLESDDAESSRGSHQRRIEFDLNKLEKSRIVATRIRPDTKVKQFHAG